MLTGRRTAAAAALVLAALAFPVPARADGPSPGGGGTTCGLFSCQVEVEVPEESGGSRPAQREVGTAGTNGGGMGKVKAPECTPAQKLEPPPPADSELWEGHDPADGGSVYVRTCRYFMASGASTMVTETLYGGPGGPPAAPAVDPAVLAQQAVDEMLLRGPEIGITPKPGGKGVVGMPVYMWTEFGP